MNPIVFAMRYPYAVMVGVVAVLIGSSLAASRMRADVFPSLNQPVIYIVQPHGGLTPAQMEGLVTNYYEYHFLYVTGVHHVERRVAIRWHLSAARWSGARGFDTRDALVATSGVRGGTAEGRHRRCLHRPRRPQ